MRKSEIKTIVFEYDSIEELNVEDIDLINKAKQASQNSYSPYSHFKVGASILLSSGEIILSNNQENAAYPSGLCAERVGIFYANSLHPDVAVKTIAIVAYTNNEFIDVPIPPCGSCRQVLLETENRFKSPIKIILAGKSKIFILENAGSLLPLNFNKNHLSM